MGGAIAIYLYHNKELSHKVYPIVKGSVMGAGGGGRMKGDEVRANRFCCSNCTRSVSSFSFSLTWYKLQRLSIIIS